MKQTNSLFKLVLLTVFAFTISNVQAQVVNDVVETNCNNTQQDTLYKWLDAGQVVLIAADGFDCSICRSHAPGISTFANDNPNIRVWGAMHYKYSSNQPNCSNINSWNASYNWNNIFMFIDEDRSWAGNGYPTYTVIDPRDKTIAYRGFSDNTAKNKALSLSQAVGIGETKTPNASINAYYANGILSISTSTIDNNTISIYNPSGVLVHQFTPENETSKLNLSLPTGIYFINTVNPVASESIKLMAY